MGSVNITLANGQLGATLQTNDGIAGLVVTGATDGSYTVGSPILVSSMASLATYGITEDGNAFAWNQVRSFYDEAGVGALLYLMLVPPTMKVHEMADHNNAAGAAKLLSYAQGKIRLLGIVSDDEAVDAESGDLTTAHALNADVYTAISNMAVLANDYFESHKPFRAVVGGTSYTGIAADLSDLTEGTNNRTALVVGDTASGAGACVGLVLGRASSIPVQRKISRVRSGALTTVKAYVGTTPVSSAAETLPVIAARGIITFMTYANMAGYFFSGDPMCTSTADDYAMLARGRVIDKAHILAYTTFVQVVDDEVPMNTDGTLDAGFCKWLSQQIVNQVNNTMTANKEISSIRCYIDPNQNILSTSRLNVVLQIVPVGYATSIEISLGFSNPANS